MGGNFNWQWFGSNLTLKEWSKVHSQYFLCSVVLDCEWIVKFLNYIELDQIETSDADGGHAGNNDWNRNWSWEQNQNLIKLSWIEVELKLGFKLNWIELN